MFNETGTKNDNNKPRLGLIHPMLLIQTAHVMAEGDGKYGAGNWKGLRLSRVIDAIERHLLAIKSGEDVDPESRKPHVAHIVSGCSFLSYFMENGITGTEQDDRPWRNGKPKMYGYDPGQNQGASLFATVVYPDQDQEVHFAEHVFGDSVGEVARLAEAFTSIDSVYQVQREVVEWADKAIGAGRTYADAISKMVMEEIPELLLDPESPLEWADVAIILLDLAHLAGIDPVAAIRHKLDVNRQRGEFKRDRKTGLFRHQRPAADFDVGDTVRVAQCDELWTVESIDIVSGPPGQDAYFKVDVKIWRMENGVRCTSIVDSDDVTKVA